MIGTNIYQDVLHPRRVTLNYISPAICEAIFSGSSFTTLLLEEQSFNTLTQVTGPRYTNWDATTNTWSLDWDVYPDALCYNIYVEGPPGTFTLVAECVPDPNYNPNDPGGHNPVGDPNDRPPGTPGNPTTPGNPPGPQTPGNPGVTVVITVVTPGGESPFPTSNPPPAPEPPFLFYSAPYVANCPVGYIGTPISKPYGAYTSTLNQSDADFKAINAANGELHCDVIYYSAEYTATCPPGFIGTPVTKAAGAYTSIISQADANQQAIAAAEFEISCVVDPGACGAVPSTFAGLVWTVALDNPPCQQVAAAGANGTFNIDLSTNGVNPCFGVQQGVDISAPICNLLAPYAFTVAINFGETGAVKLSPPSPFAPTAFLTLSVNGVDQEVIAQPMPGGTGATLHGTIPTGGSNLIRVYLVLLGEGNPDWGIAGTFTVA